MPDPLVPQLTPWRRLADGPGLSEVAGLLRSQGLSAQAWRRTVRDGMLRALVAEEPMGWHLSISFADDCNRPSRYPSWDEIAHARYELLPHDVDFVMHLPPPGEYIAVHPTTFHLHEHPER